jgi:hypothetical protein
VLQGDHFDTGPERARVVPVVGAFVTPDPMVDLEREGRAALGREQDRDLAVTRRSRQVARVRRDATAAGRIG